MSRPPRWLPCGTVSAVATATSLTVLGVLVSATAMPAGPANVIATAVGTFPSFELSRGWVWRRTGRRSMRAELVPFWILSFTGPARSTLAVSVAQFVLLDRFLFRRGANPALVPLAAPSPASRTDKAS